MVVSRPAVARGLAAARLARPVPSSALRRNLQPILRRGYASGGGDHAASSDIPWIAGAAAATIGGCYLVWPSPSHGDAHGDASGHGHGATQEYEESHDGKDEQEEDAQEQSQEQPEEQSQEDKPAESQDEGKDETPADDSGESDDQQSKGDESAKPAKPDRSEPEKTSNKKVDGVQFKGKTSAGDENKEIHDYRKREPDSKGAFKKRIDSGYQKNLGEGHHSDEEGAPSGKTAATPSGNPGAIDTKQKGLSTTPTRHSTQIDQDPEKSKKGEGVPDTAKSMTTINPKRPAVAPSDES